MKRAELIEKAERAKRESKYLDFKSEWDVTSPAAWCEVVKDVVAFANSGGGVIVFGVQNNGAASGSDLARLRDLDVAEITNKIASYTNFQFADIELLEIERGAARVIAMVISDADVPLVFIKPGTYNIGEGKQKTAFFRSACSVMSSKPSAGTMKPPRPSVRISTSSSAFAGAIRGTCGSGARSRWRIRRWLACLKAKNISKPPGGPCKAQLRFSRNSSTSIRTTRICCAS